MYQVSSLYLILIFSVFLSCSSIKNECLPDIDSGNLGSPLNSVGDELFPVIIDEVLFFSSERDGDELKRFSADLFGSSVENVRIDKTIPSYTWGNLTQMTAYNNSKEGIVELYFGATNRFGKKVHSDIYYSYNDGTGWSKPVTVDELNTSHFESYPTISSDGRFLVFSSDRPGSIGEIDLYLSERVDGKWSKPVNLGSGVNTEYSEITPFLNRNKDLFFSSNGYAEKSYNIIASKIMENGELINTRVLNEPINSDGDEKSPVISGNRILFSSNRIGSCGGFDIYSFELCRPVILDVKVSSVSPNLKFWGKINLLDEKSQEILSHTLLEGPTKRIRLKPDNKYLLRFEHPCMKEQVSEYSFFAPCSDTGVIKFVAEFEIPEIYDEFNFEEYKVPFFVTGYYLPNTDRNLQSLRMKFSYNLIGNNDSTRYIENPGPMYDNYTPTVEKALGDAAAFILDKLGKLEGECLKSNSRLEIKLTGFSDPRLISSLAKYDGPLINDSEFDLFVERGILMDNNLLSVLRAYFTAKQLQNEITNRIGGSDLKSKLIWKIEGKGVDEISTLSNEYRRRVSIRISIK